MGVDIDPARHRRADVLDGHRLTNSSGVVVDQVPLELLHLLVGQHHLRELADAGVDAVHDLVGHDLFFQHTAADLDALQGTGIELDPFAMAGNTHQRFHSQIRAIQNDRHTSFLLIEGFVPGYALAHLPAGSQTGSDPREGAQLVGQLNPF